MLPSLDRELFLVRVSDGSLVWYLSQVLLTKFTSLPPLFENTPNAAQELAIASMFLP